MSRGLLGLSLLCEGDMHTCAQYVRENDCRVALAEC
jgi:hypothetical protein